MELILYKNFAKKINSTKQPDDTVTSITTVAYMKQGTSLEAPIFLINGVDLDVTYAKWADRYYFVSDIVLGNNNIYEVHCSQDVLASHKADITGYTGYVEYCDTFYNKNIPDNRLSMTDYVDTTVSEAPTASFGDTHGTVVLTLSAKDSTAQVGLSSIYAVSDTSLSSFAEWMYSTEVITQVKDFFGGDPSKALISAQWVPFELSTGGTTLTIGTHPSTVTAHGLKDYATRAFSSVTIPIPWKNNDWRDYNPYSIMQIYLPFYGVAVIDQSKFAYEENMIVSYCYDAISGEVVYNLKAGDWYNTYKCSVAVPLAVGQQTSNALNGLATIGGGIGTLAAAVATTIATGGTTAPVALAAIGGVAAVGAGAVTAFQNESTGSGVTGGFASGNAVLQSAADSFMRKIKITLFSHRFSVNEDITTFKDIEGRPWFMKMSLSTLSGYVKCAGASISIDGLSNDREEINTWLNQGIFIE